MNNKNMYGILLFDEAYEHLSDILKPYLQKGPIGKYIYGTKAVHDGVFLNIIISPELVKGRITDDMEISIPLRFVKFVASASSLDDLIGFRASRRGKHPT
ncbi:MAG: hypothetical protein ABIJ25_10460 [Pseudomonadota bacterium]